MAKDTLIHGHDIESAGAFRELVPAARVRVEPQPRGLACAQHVRQTKFPAKLQTVVHEPVRTLVVPDPRARIGEVQVCADQLPLLFAIIRGGGQQVDLFPHVRVVRVQGRTEVVGEQHGAHGPVAAVDVASTSRIHRRFSLSGTAQTNGSASTGHAFPPRSGLLRSSPTARSSSARASSNPFACQMSIKPSPSLISPRADSDSRGSLISRRIKAVTSLWCRPVNATRLNFSAKPVDVRCGHPGFGQQLLQQHDRVDGLVDDQLVGGRLAVVQPVLTAASQPAVIGEQASGGGLAFRNARTAVEFSALRAGQWPGKPRAWPVRAGTRPHQFLFPPARCRQTRRH